MMLTRRQQMLLIVPFVALIMPFLLCPIALGFAASFTSRAGSQAPLTFVGLQNYARVLSDPTFLAATGNTLILTGVTVPLELALGGAVAFALRKPFRGRTPIRFALLLPWLISAAASGVMWHQLVNEDHGVLTFWTALIGATPIPYPLVSAPFVTMLAVEIWRKFPLVTFLVLPGLEAIPAAQWDNARLDGLSAIRQVRHVAVPHLRRLLLAVTLLLTGDALGTSESVFFLTGGGPGVSTMTIGLYSYSKAIRGANWSLAAVPGWIVVLTVLLLGWIYLSLSRSRETLRRP